MNTLGLSMGDSLLVGWRMCVSTVLNWYARWPLKWQLSNLRVWLQVRYAFTPGDEAPVLPALNEAQQQRLALYCKLQGPLTLPPGAVLAHEVSIMRHSYYVGDMLRGLYPHFLNRRFFRLFGDVNWVPDVPSLVKSRPICDSNQNAVLLPMDMRRHLRFPRDPYDFRMKRAGMVWRGASYQPHRQLLLQETGKMPFCDTGNPSLAHDDPHYKPRLTIFEQLEYKYILSIEGNDVATNLKWILNSNSLCIMPRLRFETWFLEGRLRAGVHYAELADDFSNLQQLFDHYEQHPEEALAIIRQANAYTRQFKNTQAEVMLSQHVCQAYFAATQPSPSQ